jgi:hypothetical protein
MLRAAVEYRLLLCLSSHGTATACHPTARMHPSPSGVERWRSPLEAHVPRPQTSASEIRFLPTPTRVVALCARQTLRSRQTRRSARPLGHQYPPVEGDAAMSPSGCLPLPAPRLATGQPTKSNDAHAGATQTCGRSTADMPPTPSLARCGRLARLGAAVRWSTASLAVCHPRRATLGAAPAGPAWIVYCWAAMGLAPELLG